MFKMLKIHKVHHKIILGLTAVMIVVGGVYVMKNIKGASSCALTTTTLSPTSFYKSTSGDLFKWDGALSTTNSNGGFSANGKDWVASVEGERISKESIKTIYYTTDIKVGSTADTLTNVSFDSGSKALSFQAGQTTQEVTLNTSVLSYTLPDGTILQFDGKGIVSSPNATFSLNGVTVPRLEIPSVATIIKEKGPAVVPVTNLSIGASMLAITISVADEGTPSMTFSFPQACTIESEPEPEPEPEPECVEQANVTLDPKSSPSYTLTNDSVLTWDGGNLVSKGTNFTDSDKTDFGEQVSLGNLTGILEKKLSITVTNKNTAEAVIIQVVSYNKDMASITLSVPIVCDGGSEEVVYTCIDKTTAQEKVDMTFGGTPYTLENGSDLNWDGKHVYSKDTTFTGAEGTNFGAEMTLDSLQSVFDKSIEVLVTNGTSKSVTTVNVYSVDAPKGAVSFLICGTETPKTEEPKEIKPHVRAVGSIGAGGGSAVSVSAPVSLVSVPTTNTNSNSNSSQTVTTTAKSSNSIPAKIEKPSEDCDTYLTQYIKFGKKNDTTSVEKLQKFLKNYEGYDLLNIDGVYGKATFDAVQKFQSKYLGDVLSPWSITEPTGYVFKTTVKKINELYCTYIKQ